MDVRAMNRACEPITIQEEAIEKLKQNIRGQIIMPEDPDYDAARKVYNAMHDRRPSIILRVAGVADVITAVRFAREKDLLLSVRGGGHSVPGFGTCDGGLVIDLLRMKGIRVDPYGRTARAEAGCTWGEFNHAGYAFGLATTGGVVSTTGIAGLTLGGGMGYLARRFGLSCDNLLSADVVLADGTFVTCSEEREKDLFWAIRGGGGNFGIVTSFEYRLHPVANIYAGVTFFPLEADVARAYTEFILNAPEEVGMLFAFVMIPPLPFVQPEWHFKPACAAVACWSGEPDKAEKALAPIQKWGKVVGSFMDVMPYPVINTLFDELVPPGLYQYWKGNFLREFSDAAIEAHVTHSKNVPNINSGTHIFAIDGACHRVSGDATAFAHRDANFSAVISGVWQRPADNEQHVRRVRDYYEAVTPHSEAAAYVNFLDTDDQNLIGLSYGKNYDRLVEIKTKYDPDNLFQVNQNIKPKGLKR